jgi:hypothetical protein
VSTPMIQSASPARLTVVSSIGAILKRRHRPGGNSRGNPVMSHGPKRAGQAPDQAGRGWPGRCWQHQGHVINKTRHQAAGHGESHPAPPPTNPGRSQPSPPVPTCQDSQARDRLRDFNGPDARGHRESLTWGFVVERVTGIEPALSAWEVHRSAPLFSVTCGAACPPVAVFDLCCPPLIAR